MRWWYHSADRTPVFVHYRYPRRPTPDDPRTKGYGYKYPVAIVDNKVSEWVQGKHPQADSLIYGLPLVLANPDARLVLTEGEADSDAARALGILASCHHGGAGKFSDSMAESIARHRGVIVLVADNDPAGAVDVCRRYDLLRDVGIPATRLLVREVLPRHQGADLRDHLDAGYTMRDLVQADLDRLRELAAASSGHPDEGSWPTLGPGGWQPAVVSES